MVRNLILHQDNFSVRFLINTFIGLDMRSKYPGIPLYFEQSIKMTERVKVPRVARRP